MTELPETWSIASVSETCLVMSGQTPKGIENFAVEDGEIPWFRVGNMNDPGNEEFLAKSDIHLSDDGVNELKLHVYPKDTIVFPKRGGAIATNKKRILAQPSAYDLNLMGIFPIGLDNRFFWHWFQSVDLKQLSDGSNVPQINHGDIEPLTFPLPPLKEQKRIVAKIEELRDHHQRAKQALEAVPQLCDRFRQSVLAAAFRGDLTADWREQNPDVEPASVLLERTARELRQNFEQVTREIDRSSQDLPDSWTWAKFNLFIKGIQAGKNFSCPEVPVTEDTIGLVKISAVTWGKFNPKETKTVDDLSKVDSNLFIQKGDFLISRANTLELVGASVVVDEINYKIMLSDKVWRVDFLEIDKRFINFYLKSLYGRKEIESRATGNQLSMRNISQSAFKDIVVALPPLKEQQEIATQVESIFRGIDRIVEQYQNTRDYLDRLNQSILAKAFRGELVEQDPNDEPASVLLDRIRAEREAQQSNKASRGKGAGRQRKKAIADE